MTEHDTAVADATPRAPKQRLEEVKNPASEPNAQMTVEQHHGVSQEVAKTKPKKSRLAGFDSFVAKVRDASPAWLVNNGSRFCLAFKFSADGFSIASAVRDKSRSPWRLRASLVTAGAEVLGMIFPEKDISDEQRAGYRQMSPWKFFVTKTREALNPKDYITETIGLALIVNGAFMALAGRAQSSPGNKSWEILQGMMTTVAGVIMTYWPDRERAWQLAHSTFMARSIPAALQADTAYRKGYPNAKEPAASGDWFQWAKWVLNQIANALGTLYGGVKKMPDGEILHIGMKGNDVSAPRQSRRQIAAKPVAEPLLTTSPETSITQTAQMGKVTDADKMKHSQVGAA